MKQAHISCPVPARGTVVILDSPQPEGGFKVGARVTGQVFRPLNIGWRNGDYFEGVVTNEISEEPQIVTDWTGQAHMGVLDIVDTARFNIHSFPFVRMLRFDDFALIKVTGRRTARGRRFQPVPSGEEVYARTQEAADKRSHTMKLRRLAHQHGTRPGFKAA